MYTGFVNQHAEREIASPFYQHPYGGIARDVWCTREGFARFFETIVDHVDALWPNMKVFDIADEWTECIGYKIVDRRGTRTRYRITVIEYGHSRCGILLSIAPYIWENHWGNTSHTS